MAAVGRLDLTVLPLRSARRLKEPLVLVWLFARSRRNAQRTAVVRRAVFSSLAAVAKKMDQCAVRARRVHSHMGGDRFTVASAHSRGLARCCCYCWCQSFARLAIQIAASRRVVRRNCWVRRI